jgi:colanic acid biosynthesis protein WcaH
MSDEERPARVDWITAEDWETIVRNVPIASVDLIVRHEGGIVLGRRANEPAKGEWFVPGGRIERGERIVEAVHRVAREELGVEVTVQTELGAYDHFYTVSDVRGSGKHYVAHGFVVETTSDDLVTDDQHGDLRVFDQDQLPDDLHRHVTAYLRDAGLLRA